MKQKLNIKNITNAISLGEIILNNNKKSKATWKIIWYNDALKYISLENGRIYIIVSDDEIKKIGCSECKGGMKSTFNFYQSGLGGSPSLRTFGIHHLIYDELINNKKILILGIFNEPIKVNVKGLFNITEEIIYPSIKSMEDKCKNDYKSIYNKFPPWNFQENIEEWPENIKQLYKIQVQNR